MNMAYRFPIIFWNCANLIVDSMADEELDGSTDYGKIGIAISNMIKSGISISLPLINNAEYGFIPDVKNNTIIYGFRSMNGIGDDIAQAIIQNRPYTSMQDFATRMLDTKIIHPAQMIKLIKGGCFLTLHDPDRFKTMEWYLRNYCFEPLSKLTMTQLPKMQEFSIIPEQFKDSLNCIKIKQYVLDDEGLYKLYINLDKKLPKCGYHDRYFILDDVSQPAVKKYFTEDCIVDVKDGYYIISEKDFLKEYEKLVKPLRDWFGSEDALNTYNDALFQSLWDDKASGTEASWNMEACCYYDQNHELDGINEAEYGIVNYFDLPENPEPYTWYRRKVDGEWKNVPKYRVSRIAGCVLKADNNRHSIALLTCYGVVNVKFYKGSYAFYNKRISQPLGDGKKKVLEESWLKRGNKLLISGIRRDDQFFPLVYKDTIYNHTVNLIKNITPDGKLELQFERTKVDE